MNANRAKFLTALVGAILFTFLNIVRSGAQTLGEALDTTNLVWKTGGDAAWHIQTTNTHDGVEAAQSGSINSLQGSWIETTVAGPATVSFWMSWNAFVSDHGSAAWQFSINGSIPSLQVSPILIPGNWQEQTFDLGAGTNVLRWLVRDEDILNSTKGFLVLDEFTVSPPRDLAITHQPVDQTNYSGAQTWFWVSATGTPPLQYQWRKDATNIVDATNSWLQLANLTTNDSGIYSLTISNSQGRIESSNAILSVLPPTAPSFTSEPADATAYVGENFQWTAGVSGSPPFNYAWKKDGTNVATGTFTPYFYEYHSLSVNLPTISLEDAGTYQLAVTNASGHIESSNVVLSVIPSIAPVVVQQPRSLDVASGVSTWMTLAATGTPAPNVTWTGPDLPPASSSGPQLPVAPPSIHNPDPRHLFYNATTNDAGIYSATVSNYAGAVTSDSALLAVLPAITNVGSCDQDALDIFVTNGLAFLARGTNGLAVLDVTNPASPQLLGSFHTNDDERGIGVFGDFAYVAAGSAGLEIFSITNPASPVLLNTYKTPGNADDVVVRSNLAFVADGMAGLLILNVTNAASPSFVGNYATNLSANHICLSGNYAILSSPNTIIALNSDTTYLAGLIVVDVSAPAHPLEVGRLTDSGFGNMDVRDHCVFAVTELGQGISAISITNPAEPAVIGNFAYYYTQNTLGNYVAATDVHVINGLAYVASATYGYAQLYVLNASDAAELTPVGYYTNSGQFSTLAVEGNHVFLAGNQTPLQVVQTPFDTNPITPPLLSIDQKPGMNLHIHGRHGLHYDVEYQDQLGDKPWQTVQTLLLTNDTVALPISPSASSGFFRLEQRD